MNDFNVENFWQEVKRKDLQKFKYKADRYYSRRREIWQNLIIVIATILGFSLGLISITEGKPSLFLQITWILQILIIIYGFFLLVIDNEINLKRERASFEFSYDMSEISIMESKGAFITNKELKSGLLVSAMNKMEKIISVASKSQFLWTEYAKGLIEKYSSQLPSNKIFIQKEKIGILNRLLNWANLKINKLNFGFYLLISLSFIFLFISIFA